MEDESNFKIEGHEIGEAQNENVKSTNTGVSRITLKKNVIDFLRKPRVLKVHKIVENGRPYIVLEVAER